MLLTHLRTMTTNHYSHVQLKSHRKRFILILMTTTIRENHQAHQQGTCVKVMIEHTDPQTQDQESIETYLIGKQTENLQTTPTKNQENNSPLKIQKVLRKPLTEKTEAHPDNTIESPQTTVIVANTKTENITQDLAEIMNTTAMHPQDIAD